MPDIPGQLRRLFTSWRGDVLLAAVLVACAAAYLVAAAPTGDQGWTDMIFVLPWAAVLAVRQRWPVAAVAVACALLLAARPLGFGVLINGVLGVLLLWVIFLLAYALGTGTGPAAGLAGAVLLAACLLIANDGFNPIAFMITIGPWLAGLAVKSRRRMTEQLEVRNEELRAEQELFALESVRYERARIARELHDIVAHCLSVMVVQASAGQRIADGAAEALRSVAEAAAQAQAEIGRLVELLSGDLPPGTSPRLPMAGELVRRASVTGLAVSCRFQGPCDGLTPEASEAAYRVVQEALTNALKHAPGAPVDITICGQDAGVTVDVVNAAPPGNPSGLERSGGSYGLAGMQERVSACGGRLTSGPTASGGWHVTAFLPASYPGTVPCGSSSDLM
jgi:signal transduction histidine kinase